MKILVTWHRRTVTRMVKALWAFLSSLLIHIKHVLSKVIQILHYAIRVRFMFYTLNVLYASW